MSDQETPVQAPAHSAPGVTFGISVPASVEALDDAKAKVAAAEGAGLNLVGIGDHP